MTQKENLKFDKLENPFDQPTLEYPGKDTVLDALRDDKMLSNKSKFWVFMAAIKYAMDDGQFREQLFKIFKEKVESASSRTGQNKS